jgi:hypothetical protein
VAAFFPGEADALLPAVMLEIPMTMAIVPLRWWAGRSGCC